MAEGIDPCSSHRISHWPRLAHVLALRAGGHDPVTVNHEERRKRIAEITVKVIARDGIDAATVRQIAEEVGFSTSIVTYYFANKQALLLATYQSLHDEAFGKVSAAYDRDPTNLAACLINMTAADEISFNRWRAYVAFWDRAAREAHWALRQREDYDCAVAWIECFIKARNGEIAGLAKVSRFLNTFIQGISVLALMDPQEWTRDRIAAQIAEAIDMTLEPKADGAAASSTGAPPV